MNTGSDKHVTNAPLRIIAIAPCFNEEAKIGHVVRRVPRDTVEEILVIDDGSTDNSVAVAKAEGATVIELGACLGVGVAIRTAYQYALDHDYDIAVVMAGNNKDSPEEIPALVQPIVAGEADFVQGSRFLKKDASFGDMPFYRRIATRLHPLLFSLVARKWVTESTNGFRATSKKVLQDERIDLSQSWLNEYELEPYLYFKTIRLGYRTAEVPVSKVYPPKHLGQTKMKPITGWWSILRPLFYLGLGIKK